MSTLNQKECCDPNCTFSKTSLILGDVWNLLIINNLLTFKTLRFSEFTSKINGLSNSILSNRLKSLIETDIVEKDVLTSNTELNVYILTEKGKMLKSIFEEIKKFKPQ